MISPPCFGGEGMRKGDAGMDAFLFAIGLLMGFLVIVMVLDLLAPRVSTRYSEGDFERLRKALGEFAEAVKKSLWL